MSKASGTSRIPTFGSKIPQIKSKPNLQLTTKDIGTKVRISEKEGVLRYIGNVHFSDGIWCGIELNTNNGKNDGIVNGTRYFNCPQNCGLMAPLHKVQLINNIGQHCGENLEDNGVSSGPYSMLFIDQEITNENNETFIKNNENSLDGTNSINNSSNESNETVINNITQIEKTLETVFNNSTTTNFNDSNNKCLKNDDTIIINKDNNIKCSSNATFCNFDNNKTDGIDNKTFIATTINKGCSNDIFTIKNKLTSLSQLELLNNQNLSTSDFSSPPSTATTINNKTFITTTTNEQTVIETNRRRTRTIDKSYINDILTIKNKDIIIDKPTSLPQLKLLNNQNLSPNDFSSPPSTTTINNKTFTHSTPIRNNAGKFEEILLKKLQTTTNLINNTYNIVDDDNSKRDSLEFEESLGILTPEQMIDGLSYMSAVGSRTSSSEFIRNTQSSNDNNKRKLELSSPHSNDNNDIIIKSNKRNLEKINQNKTELPSPNLASLAEFSFELIDDQILSNLSILSNTTVNMELPLDKSESNKFVVNRLEETPSPEDLPLDPIPIIGNNLTKINNTTDKSKSSTTTTTTNSFITSVTSITSLDTGYQGDGEMSRPASRGADNSPLTRRPILRSQTRKPAEPMTDSDFYTESDHEDNLLKGDRKAQVIDGTLYGVDPQAAEEIYVNRETMDSSGIFTDIESNNLNTEHNSISNGGDNNDISPSDSSTKTISPNNQNNNLNEIINNKNNVANNKVSIDNNNKDNNNTNETKKDVINTKKRNATSPAVSSPSSIRSPKHGMKDDIAVGNKFKMPKRDVQSKIKVMLEEPNTSQQSNDNKNNNTKNLKKPIGRWDSVMNKISKSDQNKTNLKDIKSKVFSNIQVINNNVVQKQKEQRKLTVRQNAGQNTKPRRVRARVATNNTTITTTSSIHSSMSDLSAAGVPLKKTPSSVKKRDVVQVTQVLTASKLSPRTPQQNTATSTENKKISPLTSNDAKTKRTLFPSKDKTKQTTVKDCTRSSVKGGRTSPAVRPPIQTRAVTKPVPKVAEALAVLVQHLVFNVEAYKVPNLKKEVQKFRSEIEEVRLTCQQLEESVENERAKNLELVEQHKKEINELNNQHLEFKENLLNDNELNKNNLIKQNEEQILILKNEFERLQKTHSDTLDILREENDAIREQIDEKNVEIEKTKQEYELKILKLTEGLYNSNKENEKVRTVNEQMQNKLKEIQIVYEDNSKLREENDRLLSYGDDKGISMQEVQSLRAVLELKQNEVAELRRSLAEVTQKNEILVGAEEKAAALNARCEDLQLQLQRKSEYEQLLITENRKLQDSFKEEINQKKRLCQYNEELQWKLKQNKEVVSKVLEQAEESVFNRSLLSASFNERYNNSARQHLERRYSFRERLDNKNSNIILENQTKKLIKNSLEFDLLDDSNSSGNTITSPPNSPKVKGVVEKSDSVSYVLDLDESPEIVASRIVRRSFRQSTPQKTTPTKSPSNKRPRMKNPLSLSASASAILPINKNERFIRSRSVSVRNGSGNGGGGSGGDDNSEECDLENLNNHHDLFLCSNGTSSQRNNSNSNSSNGDSKKSDDSKLDHLDFDGDKDDDDDDDEDNDEDDMQLPALPSEFGRKNSAQALPSPKHLAGEAMISDRNSDDDESTSSSSVQL